MLCKAVMHRSEREIALDIHTPHTLQISQNALSQTRTNFAYKLNLISHFTNMHTTLTFRHFQRKIERLVLLQQQQRWRWRHHEEFTTLSKYIYNISEILISMEIPMPNRFAEYGSMETFGSFIFSSFALHGLCG